MVVQELPAPVRDFAGYLGGLLGRVDPRAGWCGVFWRRDPDGMRAFLAGHEVPPWDIVEDLLHDLAAGHGPRAADQERGTARALHARAAAAHDARPGGREALRDRLEATLREEREAAARLRVLRGPSEPAGDARAAEALRADLAWARADHERAVARAAELRDRLEVLAAARHASWEAGAPQALPAQELPPYGLPLRGLPSQDLSAQGIPAQDLPAQGFPRQERNRPVAGECAQRPETGPAAHGPAGEGGGSGAGAGAVAGGGGAEAGAGAAAGGRKQKRKRPRGSARFAGMPEEPQQPAGPAAPVLPGTLPSVPEPDAGTAPRGARFAGAADGPGGAQTLAEPDAEDRAAVAGGVARLLRLRGQGRSGEAHALLAEMARWPACRLPLAAEHLEGSGGEAEWATLLWEASSLPVPRLVPVADALAAAGRPDDGQRVLRQGVARPAEEMADAVAALCDARCEREVRLLMDAYVRSRVPAETARCAAGRPARMVPLLLAAARGVSQDRYWDVVHALRVAGVPGA